MSVPSVQKATQKSVEDRMPVLASRPGDGLALLDGDAAPTAVPAALLEPAPGGGADRVTAPERWYTVEVRREGYRQLGCREPRPTETRAVGQRLRWRLSDGNDEGEVASSAGMGSWMQRELARLA